MKPIFIILTLLAVTTLFTAGVTAQANNSTTDTGVDVNVGSQESEQDPCDEPERVDNSTVICSADMDGQYAELVVQSDRRQRVVLTDAAGFMQGGEINRQTFMVTDDGPQTLRLRVTSYNGFTGVTIDTGDVLYAVPIEEQTSVIGGPYDEQDVQLSAIGGAISVALVSIVVTIRAVTGRSDSPERIA